jgi:ATP/maltotriose-dependent transcriptional regulator MalT
VPGTWLSLDEEDSNLAQFATYLPAAVRTLSPDYAKQRLLGR